VFTSDTQAIMSEINQLIRAIYTHYFQSETTTSKENQKLDLITESL